MDCPGIELGLQLLQNKDQSVDAVWVTWESFKTCPVYTFSAPEGHTEQCIMNGTAESKTDLLTWGLCAVLRPQNGPLCVHSVAALSGRLTSVKGTHICRLNVESNMCP